METDFGDGGDGGAMFDLEDRRKDVDLDEAEDQEKEKPPPPPLSDFIKEKLKRNKEVSCPISILFSFPFSP